MKTLLYISPRKAYVEAMKTKTAPQTQRHAPRLPAAFRLTPELAERIDRFVDGYNAVAPGVQIKRSAAIRMLLERALSAAKK
jgi:hypothetical protein